MLQQVLLMILHHCSTKRLKPCLKRHMGWGSLWFLEEHTLLLHRLPWARFFNYGFASQVQHASRSTSRLHVISNVLLRHSMVLPYLRLGESNSKKFFTSLHSLFLDNESHVCRKRRFNCNYLPRAWRGLLGGLHLACHMLIAPKSMTILEDTPWFYIEPSGASLVTLGCQRKTYSLLKMQGWRAFK